MTRTVDISAGSSDEMVELPNITVDLGRGLPHVSVYRESNDGWEEIVTDVLVTSAGKIKIKADMSVTLKAVVTTP